MIHFLRNLLALLLLFAGVLLICLPTVADISPWWIFAGIAGGLICWMIAADLQWRNRGYWHESDAR